MSFKPLILSLTLLAIVAVAGCTTNDNKSTFGIYHYEHQYFRTSVSSYNCPGEFVLNGNSGQPFFENLSIEIAQNKTCYYEKDQIIQICDATECVD